MSDRVQRLYNTSKHEDSTGLAVLYQSEELFAVFPRQMNVCLVPSHTIYIVLPVLGIAQLLLRILLMLLHILPYRLSSFLDKIIAGII